MSDSECDSDASIDLDTVNFIDTEKNSGEDLFVVDVDGQQGSDSDEVPLYEDEEDETSCKNEVLGSNLSKTDKLCNFTSNLDGNGNEDEEEEEADDDDDDNDGSGNEDDEEEEKADDDVDDDDEEEDDEDEEEEEDDEDDDDKEQKADDRDKSIDVRVPNFSMSFDTKSPARTASSSKKEKKYDDELDLNNTYLDMQLSSNKIEPINLKARMLTKIDEIMKKSVITPGYEKLDAVPAYSESYRALQKKRKKERELTKGSQWFNMPATEITEELKKDLEVLQMRSVLDPKHFYKKNDLKVLPKYFQVGKVADNAVDFYNSRIPKKNRKRTMVEELMADAEFKNYNKRRYKEIIEQRRKTHYKAHVKAKKLKRRK